MNIKALVASLVLGVVGTSTAALASPFDGRREGHPIIEHRPGFEDRRFEDHRRFEDRRFEDHRRFEDRRFEDHRRFEDRRFEDHRRFEGRRPVIWHGPVFAGHRR